MKRILLNLVMLLLISSVAWAQERTVTGTVTSAEDGSGLPGVNVIIKGTTTGTVTDIDGKFKLSVPDGAVLQFSAVGLAAQEVAVGSRSVIDLSMEQDVKQLSEVVVTAVGIQREAKALGYAVERVSSDKIQQVSEPDPLRALQGKVPGVNIGGSGGAPGSATRITIRGNSSLLGNNQPLVVVDGIPYNNNTNSTFGGLVDGSAGGNRLLDLDPNNIESVNILKGAAAAALYGTRAANGVLVITTKTGSTTASKKGLEVTYGMTYTMEEIANLPELQNTYGTGTNFQYAQANGSWGAPFIGTKPYANLDSINHWYNGRPGMEPYWGTRVPYRAYPNNVKDLFQTGSLFENTVTVQGGNAKSNLAVTASRSNNEGYVPNTSFERTNISVGGRTQLDNKFSVGGNLAYTKSFQRAVQSGVGLSGSNNSSAFARALFLGRNWDIHGQPFQNPVDNGSEFMVARGQADNPLWSYENAGATSSVNRSVASLDLGYDVLEWINLNYKIGINAYTQNNVDFIRPGSTGPSSNPGVGRVVEDYFNWEEIESTFLVSLKPNIGETFSLSATLGHNVNQRTSKRQAFQGLGYVTFDIDDIDNTNDVTPFGGDYTQRRLYGVFGEATLGYNDWAFLNVAARNDWSSTLPQGGNSFFYPAITGSVVLSDALGISSDLLSSLKVRGGWSQVGSDTDPYQLNPVFNINGDLQNATGALPFLGVPGASLSNIARDPNLLPEQTREVEAGIDVALLKNKVKSSITVYQRKSGNQIGFVSLPATTGFSSLLTNFGEISNTGIEISLDVTPVQLDNGFTWNIFGTYTHNRNVIESLAEGIDQITLGGGYGIISVHIPGQEYGLIQGTVAARDDEGNLLIDPSNGQLLTSLEPAIIGNPNPDFIVGLTNRLSFKGISLNVVLDWKQGGDIYSNTVSTQLGRGVTKFTENREINKVIPGVYGDPVTLDPIRTEEGEKIENTTMIEENALWFGNTFAINGLDEFAVWDATTIRLREVTLGYQLPQSLMDKTPFGSASISFIGRNLWFNAPNLPEYSNFDPEINQFGNSNTQGIEWAATPSTRRYGVSLRITF
ncbi:SusC/RagA family TonB-linked outer membrane protein [Cytophagales bacterium LB-30]|uniref:SusC/RagA family TonB-linked outer membrane protein n=1 Tax=Shiella aurantiaca TaxID=3058365 RepID=A0ABT8F6W1_9BACT|nr:SusC/RagA family TonB-linked outer membrane protein [Shiella aurantiaca]MDN4165941.1 SusC/RagA family TonB-linked outer membrane protein [Shiella aurantiaca]